MFALKPAVRRTSLLDGTQVRRHSALYFRHPPGIFLSRYGQILEHIYDAHRRDALLRAGGAGVVVDPGQEVAYG